MPNGAWLPSAYCPLLEGATRGDDAAIRARATTALSALGDAVYERVVDRARSPDPEKIIVRASELGDLLLGPALRRAVPAFRQRFADPSFAIRLAAARSVWQLEGASAGLSESIAAGLWGGMTLPVPRPDPAARARLQDLVAHDGQVAMVDALDDLARAGPASADSLDLIRQCMSLPPSIYGVQPAAAAALVLVAQDRASLRVLHKRYDPTFADSTMAYGSPTGGGETVAGAILYLEPDDQQARHALGLGSGPLLTALTRTLIEGKLPRDSPSTALRWLLELLLLREQGAAAARP